jgi:hypothetical protein
LYWLCPHSPVENWKSPSLFHVVLCYVRSEWTRPVVYWVLLTLSPDIKDWFGKSLLTLPLIWNWSDQVPVLYFVYIGLDLPHFPGLAKWNMLASFDHMVTYRSWSPALSPPRFQKRTCFPKIDSYNFKVNVLYWNRILCFVYLLLLLL